MPLDPESTVRLIGATLRRVHETEVTGPQSDASLTARRNRVNVAGLLPAIDGPYVGRSGQELLAIFDSQFAELGEPDELLLVHGALDLDRCWVAPNGELYLTDWDRSGVGDRHLDVSAIAVATADHFGPAAVAPLIDAYGFDRLEPARLDMCQLLNYLVTATRDAEPKGSDQ